MIEKIEQYIIRFLEHSHPDFSGMPPCPFAKKERLDNRILYREGRIRGEDPSADLISYVREFSKEEPPKTLIYFDVDIACSVEDAYLFAQKIIDACVVEEILAVPVHPSDCFSINGVQTRSPAPTVMVVIQGRQQIADAKAKLVRTSYYNNCDDIEERIVGMVADSITQHQPRAEFVQVWWTDAVLASIQHGTVLPEPILGSTVEALDRNGVYRWLKRFGALHGWSPLSPFRRGEEKLQVACMRGNAVICTGFGGTDPGHLSFLSWDEEQGCIVHTPEQSSEFPNLVAQYCWIWKDDGEGKE